MNAATPIVFVAILAKQKEEVLPYYLECLKNWTYPKNRIILWVRTNNNTDATEYILEAWLEENANDYLSVEYDSSDHEIRVQDYGIHEWNDDRFTVLKQIRNESVERATELDADFYFISDMDNFIYPDTLDLLVERNLPVVAPMLYYAPPGKMYSNFHNVADADGYFQDNPEYAPIWNRSISGLIKVDVVHCTYLIRRDIFDYARYTDETLHYDYVVLSRYMRDCGIPQYLDNTRLFGCLTLEENAEACRLWMEEHAYG